MRRTNMGKLRALNTYQKFILVVLMGMILAFSAAYPIVMSREGFEYGGSLLIRSEENGNTVYSGRLRGAPAAFTVASDNTVGFRYGDTTYGPYAAKEDPTAVTDALPAEFSRSETVGVELRCGEEVIFRGSKVRFGSGFLLFDENGERERPITDLDTREERMAPSVYTVLELMDGPELTHRGHALGWFGGTAVCLLTGIGILFADELFRWGLKFMIADPEHAEPADWELARRHISWTILPILALIVYLTALIQI